MTRRCLRLALVLGPLVALTLSIGAAPAGAAITKRQSETEVVGSSGSVTLTLSPESLAGSMLVAVLGNGTAGASFSAPAGWSRAVSSSAACCGEEEIWYYPNNPGGISSATFTAASGSTSIIGELSEWTGVDLVSPVDVTGSAVQTAAATSVTVSTSGAAAAGDLGITGFATSGTGLTSFSAGSGWSHLFNDLANGYVGDSRLNLPGGATNEKETSNPAVAWVGVIATFKASTCSGGSLSLSSPSSLDFSSVALNGTDRTTNKTLALTPDDESGSGAGWSITGTSTALTNTSGRTLSTDAVQVTAATKALLGANCSQPTNSITYPVALPAGPGPPTAAKLYNASAGTGAGPATVTLTFQLTVAANSFRGTFTSTWTFAIVSGP